MKKGLLFTIMSLFLILGACGQTEEEKEVSSIESQEKETEDVSEESEESEETEEATEETKEINETLIDNDNVKAVMTGIKKVVDKEWDEERYEISIEIENKREDTIEIQAHEVSADGKMIDDMVFFSETVAGGKMADAIMAIENYEGDLPELENDLEFTLDVYSHDDYDYEDKQKVKIDF